MSKIPALPNTAQPIGLDRLRQLSNDMVVETVAISAARKPDRVAKPPSKRAIAVALAIWEQWGQIIPLMIGDDGTIIAGYEFWLAANELGLETIKVVRLSQLSRDHARVLTIALARLPQLSEWDEDALRSEFTELLSLDLGFDFQDISGFTIGEMDVVLEKDDEGDKSDPLDEVPLATVASEVVTLAGDLWRLGEHAIICGNALTAEVYERLLAGRVARLCMTDPPYNVKVENNVSGLGAVKHKDFAMAIGEMSFEQFSAFLKLFLVLTCQHLPDGSLLYVFMDRRKLEELFLAAREAGLSIVDLCCWSKGNGGMGSFYRSAHEPCAVFKSGKASFLNNVELGRHGRYRTNVWDHRGMSSFSKGRKEALAWHPTVKPVNLLAEAIKDSTRRGDIVLDPFLGSGSTLIAAEKCGRVAYGVELKRLWEN